MPQSDRQWQGGRGNRALASTHTGAGVHRQKALSSTPENLPLIALTSGEPAGIGPDICIQLALEAVPARLLVLGDPANFEARAQDLKLEIRLDQIDDLAAVKTHQPGSMQILPVALAVAAKAGKLNPLNSQAVIDMLEIGARACIDGQATALVTAPVHKSVINSAGIPFTGHTEYLGELTGSTQAVMLLASDKLRVALATTHLPLAKVPAAITRGGLERLIRIVEQDLKMLFGLSRPRILVLGLNPHAGENGVLGSEEQDTIEPVVAALKSSGIDVVGPVSADTAFTTESLKRCDVVIAMYHDQGLPVLKSQGFGEIVNITLGLPIIRTSVDHGTALSLAGTGKARHASLRAAIDIAIALATNRSQ